MPRNWLIGVFRGENTLCCDQPSQLGFLEWTQAGVEETLAWLLMEPEGDFPPEGPHGMEKRQGNEVIQNKSNYLRKNPTTFSPVFPVGRLEKTAQE